MLNDTQVKNTKPAEKPYKLADERGLFLFVTPTGSKLWRFRYRIDGREKLLSLGAYPDTSLKRAREKRDENRKLVADEIDPAARRRDERLARGNTFETVAREWFEKFSPKWAKGHAEKVIARLERNIFAYVGSRPIGKLVAADMLACLRRIEARGAVESAHRAKQVCSMVFRYAVATGRADRDPCSDLRGALASPNSKHYPTIVDPPKIGALLRAIHGYDGSPIVRSALKLAPLVFTRPGEIRGARWSEMNLDGREWRIPAERMKMRTPHIVPLSTQAVEILEELRELTGSSEFVFPSPRSSKRPLSDNALIAALRRMGYAQGDFVPHSFRSMASTLLNEQGWNSDWIEKQLAHEERDESRGSYNHAQYLADRVRMMQHWSDYLDGLRAGGNVVPIRRMA